MSEPWKRIDWKAVSETLGTLQTLLAPLVEQQEVERATCSTTQTQASVETEGQGPQEPVGPSTHLEPQNEHVLMDSGSIKMEVEQPQVSEPNGALPSKPVILEPQNQQVPVDSGRVKMKTVQSQVPKPIGALLRNLWKPLKPLEPSTPSEPQNQQVPTDSGSVKMNGALPNNLWKPLESSQPSKPVEPRKEHVPVNSGSAKIDPRVPEPSGALPNKPVVLEPKNQRVPLNSGSEPSGALPSNLWKPLEPSELSKPSDSWKQQVPIDSGSVKMNGGLSSNLWKPLEPAQPQNQQVTVNFGSVKLQIVENPVQEPSAKIPKTPFSTWRTNQAPNNADMTPLGFQERFFNPYNLYQSVGTAPPPLMPVPDPSEPKKKTRKRKRGAGNGNASTESTPSTPAPPGPNEYLIFNFKGSQNALITSEAIVWGLRLLGIDDVDKSEIKLVDLNVVPAYIANTWQVKFIANGQLEQRLRGWMGSVDYVKDSHLENVVHYGKNKDQYSYLLKSISKEATAKFALNFVTAQKIQNEVRLGPNHLETLNKEGKMVNLEFKDLLKVEWFKMAKESYMQMRRKGKREVFQASQKLLRPKVQENVWIVSSEWKGIEEEDKQG